MNKIVINRCYGGFGLSDAALEWLRDRGCIELVLYKGDFPGLMGKYDYPHFPDDWSRHHPLLVVCVETLGEEASDSTAQLEVVTINDNRYRIDEYDGMESAVIPNTHEWTVIE